MTALNASGVAAFLRNPDLSRRSFLIFGTDYGLVSEYRERLIKRLLGNNSDPFALVKMDADSLDGDPGRLMDELSTIAMFGGERVIWLRAINARIDGRALAGAIEPALELKSGGFLVIEAGDLKDKSPLRRLFTLSNAAYALPCYPDAAAELGRLVDEELRDAGLSITQTARAELISHLGGDRIASRQELKKLVLYCHGKTMISEEDVAEICGDISVLHLDNAIDAMSLGQERTAMTAYRRLIAENNHPTVIVGAALRHMMWLYLSAQDIEQGKPLRDVRDNARPKFHFKRVDAVDRQLGLWTSGKARNAYRLLTEADLEVRVNYALAPTLAERALLRVAAMVRGT